MADPSSVANELHTTGPMFGSGDVAAAIIPLVMAVLTLLFAFFTVRGLVTRLRFARRLRRRFANVTELREGEAEIAGVVEPVGDPASEPARPSDGALPSPEAEPVVQVRLFEDALRFRGGFSWRPSGVEVAIHEFRVRLSGSDERVLVSPGDCVRLVLPAAQSVTTTDPNRCATTIAIRPGEKVIVSGTLDRVQSSEADGYRESPKTFRLRAAAAESIVVTPERAARGLYEPSESEQRKIGTSFGVLGAAVALLSLTHFLVFQLAGPVVIGTVTGLHDETSKNRTSSLAEITYLDSTGSAHRIDRGYGYFTETPRVGMNVRVQYFPVIPSDGELWFDGLSLGMFELLGFILGTIPLAIGVAVARRQPRLTETREFQIQG